MLGICTCTAETESEKQISVELEIDNDVLIGQNFVVKAIITNKATTDK